MGSKKELTPNQRALIADDHKNGESFRKIASNIFFVLIMT